MRATQVATRGKEQVVDITDVVEDYLRDAERPEGVCVVFAAHTTCALTTADLDPGTDLDLLQALRSMLPQQRYRHPHDPEHTPDHIADRAVCGAALRQPPPAVGDVAARCTGRAGRPTPAHAASGDDGLSVSARTVRKDADDTIR